MRRYALTAMTALLATVGIHASAGTSAASKEGVWRSPSYAPKPFHTNDARMRVRFTTTGRARPGFEYFVVYSIYGPDSVSDKCASLGFSDEKKHVVRKQTILGAAGRTYTVVFKPGSTSLHLRPRQWLLPRPGLCRNHISVNEINPSKKTSRLLGATIAFRVIRAS